MHTLSRRKLLPTTEFLVRRAPTSLCRIGAPGRNLSTYTRQIWSSPSLPKTSYVLNARQFCSQKDPWIAPSAAPKGANLSKYTKDLTKEAEEGRLDPVIGRDGEIGRTIQVLSRRTKNNPVLIGEPGVGKTGIVC